MDEQVGTNVDVETSATTSAIALVVGPVVFVAAWMVAGAGTPDYVWTERAISWLAASGAPRQPVMVAGFLTYAAAMAVAATDLRGSALWALSPPLVVHAVAVSTVAATPLGITTTIDRAHVVAAASMYGSLVLVVLQGAASLLRAGLRSLAIASLVVAGAATGLLIWATLLRSNGLLQRAGLTAGQAWMVAAGIGLLTGKLERGSR